MPQALPPVRLGDQEPHAVDLLAVLDAAFARAAERCRSGVRESDYVLAGRRVRLRLAGKTLAQRIAEPFAHVRMTPVQAMAASPCLTIDLWDERETGIRAAVETAANDFKVTLPTAGGAFAVSPDGRLIGYRIRQTVAWLDRKAERIVGSVECADELSLHERGKPLQVLLSVWHADQGTHVVHAGLVADNGNGVLLAGKGGTGKSTSTLACVSAGFTYVGEDCIGLADRRGHAFVGHSLYSSTWLEPADVARFPLLAPHAVPATHPEERKSLILLSRAVGLQFARAVLIRAVALPRVVAAAESRIRPASKHEALFALAPSSLLEMVPRPGARGLERLADLVERVPAYWLEMGGDLGRIPHCVREMLATATLS